MMISGNDGILSRAGNAKGAIGQATAEEEVKRAILSLQIDEKGSNNGITPAKIAEQVNKDNGRTDVTAEGTDFPTNIVYGDGRKVYVKLNLTVGSVDDVVEPGLYPINNVTESQVAPPDLFTYEPLTTGANNTKVASTNGLDNLPKKTIKITGIKEEYLNGYTGDSSDTGNYGITYKTDNFTLTNTLIIPYQVIYEGEMYRVTEVDLTQKFTYSEKNYGAILPNIGYIIYPNTVTKISYDESKGEAVMNVSKVVAYGYSINIQKQVILPSSLTEIPYNFFNEYCGKSVVIPKSIKKLNERAFASARTTIYYMGTADEWENNIQKESETFSQSNIQYVFDYDINLF